MGNMFELTGGIHYVIMLMAAATASKWMDDDEDGPCLCMQHTAINPYAFINHILMSSMHGGKMNKRSLEEAESQVEEDSETNKPSSSLLDNLFGRNPDDP